MFARTHGWVRRRRSGHLPLRLFYCPRTLVRFTAMRLPFTKAQPRSNCLRKSCSEALARDKYEAITKE